MSLRANSIYPADGSSNKLAGAGRARWILLGFCPLLVFPAIADRYSYQDRGDRREGIRPKPVSGDDIELISARAEPVGGPAGAVSQQMQLRFFLPTDEKVQVTVRELDYRHYYWMDRVRPAKA